MSYCIRDSRYCWWRALPPLTHTHARLESGVYSRCGPDLQAPNTRVPRSECETHLHCEQVARERCPIRKHRVTLRSHPNTILLKTDSRLPQKLEKNLLRHKTSVPTILKKCRSRCSRKSAVTPNSLPCSCSISIPLGALGVPRRMQSVGSLAFFFFSMYLHVAVV